MDELISVVIPVYNAQKYLNRCVDTVLKQTYDKLEIILVDDGSTDNSGDICDSYVRRDHRICVIHKDNGGLSSARNSGIKHANGKYLTFIDSDDFISEDYVDYLYTLLKKYEADISVCKSIKTEKESQQNIRRTEKIIIYEGIPAAKMNLYQRNISPSAWGKLYKRELFDNTEYPYGMLYEDLGTTYKLLSKAKVVVVGNLVKYYYWQNSEGIMQKSFSEKKMDRVKIAEDILRNVSQNIPELEKPAEARFFLANIQVIREIPCFGKNFQREKKMLKENIKIYREKVMHDQNAPRKIKLMAYSSYFGILFLKLEGIIYKAFLEEKEA